MNDYQPVIYYSVLVINSMDACETVGQSISYHNAKHHLDYLRRQKPNNVYKLMKTTEIVLND